jgi:Atypical Arm repeat
LKHYCHLQCSTASATATNSVCNTAFHSRSRTTLEQIEALQMHDNNAIYNKALKILTKYFGVDEEDTTIAPATDGQTFAFGQGLPPGG